MNISAIVAARRVKDPNHVEIIDDFDAVDLSDIPIDTHPAEPCDDPHFMINDGFETIDLSAIPIDTHLAEPFDDDDLHPWAAWEKDETDLGLNLDLSTACPTACPQCAVDHWCSRHAYRAYKKRKVVEFRRRRAELAQRV